MATQDDRNLSDALVQLGREQGQILALHTGEDWQRVLRDMLRIAGQSDTEDEIRHLLTQVEQAIRLMRYGPCLSGAMNFRRPCEPDDLL
jgi:hypothetical protein